MAMQLYVKLWAKAKGTIKIPAKLSIKPTVQLPMKLTIKHP